MQRVGGIVATAAHTAPLKSQSSKLYDLTVDARDRTPLGVWASGLQKDGSSVACNEHSTRDDI